MLNKQQQKAAKLGIYVDGVQIGYVVGDTFYKTVKKSAHFLQQPPAIAFAETSLDDAVSIGANRVIVYDSEGKKTYAATIQKIWQDGFTVQRAGFEKQRALAIEKFAVFDGQSKQMSFWDDV